MRKNREFVPASIVLLSALLGLAGCFTDVTNKPRLDGGGSGGMGPVDGNGASGGASTVDAKGDVALFDDSGHGGASGGAGGNADRFLLSDANATGGVGGGTGNPDVAASTGGAPAGSGGGSGGSLGDGPMAPDASADAPVVTPDAAPDQQGGADAFVPSSNGALCQVGPTCASKNCVDGVCCDTTASVCTGCNACSNAMTGKADGTCAPVITGQNPHKSCVDETPTKQCGNDGTCDGAGACRKVSTSHVCTSASCTAGTFTPVSTCDGLGACKTVVPQDCGAFQCDTTGCLKTCTAQTDCDASTSYCNTATGKCAAKGINGTPASQTYECTSGIVADGVCCNIDCTGCKACTNALTGGTTGQCLPVSVGKVAHNACTASGTSCGLDGTCDGAGACSYLPKEGASCDDASNRCITGRTCQNHVCTAGTTKTCGASDQCHIAGTCDPATGNCSNPSGNQGQACTGTDSNLCNQTHTCQSGSCVGSNPKTCTASDQCHAAGTCNPATGTCSNPTGNEGQACTGADSNLCNQTHTCQSGTCVGSNPKPCAALDQCHTAGTCNPATGTCSNPAKADGQSCTDNNPCTNDSCQGGSCISTQIYCNSPPACKQTTTCSAGSCNYTLSVPNGTQDAKCASATPYCYGGNCVGCTSDAQCPSTKPTCDLATNTCGCRKPSAGNLLANPGFDGSMSGWTNLGTVSLSADSDGCSASNSIYCGLGGDQRDPRQCITLPAGIYYFGGKFKGGDNTGENQITIDFYDGPGCTGNNFNEWQYYLVQTSDWVQGWSSFTAPSGSVSALVGVITSYQYLDQLYVNSSNQF